MVSNATDNCLELSPKLTPSMTIISFTINGESHRRYAAHQFISEYMSTSLLLLSDSG